MNHVKNGKIENPLKLIADDHCWQLVLCDGLETIADTLPNDVDYRLISLASEVLKKAISQHNRLEEEALFPILLGRLNEDSHLRSAFKQLHQEHETDGEHALEIADELDRIVINRRVENPEMLGYMLRGFFDALRRHINWENQTVLPLAADLLTTKDLVIISRWIDEHPETIRCGRLLRLVGKHLGHTTCPHRTQKVQLLVFPERSRLEGEGHSKRNNEKP